MKTLFTILITLFTLTFLSNQEVQAQHFYQGTGHLKAGIGLGGYGIVSGTTLPAIALAYDHGFQDDFAGIGNLGLGVVIAVKNYRYNFISVKYNYNRIFIAPRGTVHFDIKNPDFDVYAGLQLGFYIWTTSSNLDADPFSSNIGLAPGIFGGANYFFNDKFGVYGELGYGIGFLNIGLVMKL